MNAGLQPASKPPNQRRGPMAKKKVHKKKVSVKTKEGLKKTKKGKGVRKGGKS
jgi:hypothetical protein